MKANYINLTTVNSTNTYLLDLYKQNKDLPEGTVVTAQHQTAGRGQNKNIWLSDANQNIMMSVLLKPDFLDPANYFKLLQATALSVTSALTTACRKAICIKWPNDIFWNNYKLGGILIEHVVEHHKLSASVIGIGVNANQTTFNVLGENKPTSLAIITAQSFDVASLIESIFNELVKHYNLLQQGLYKQLDELYKNALFRYNQEAYFFNETRAPFLAKIVDVSSEGKLGLLEQNNQLLYWDFTTIKHLL